MQSASAKVLFTVLVYDTCKNEFSQSCERIHFLRLTTNMSFIQNRENMSFIQNRENTIFIN